MKRIAVLLTIAVATLTVRADDPPKLPLPAKEHEWLQQLAGEWETDAEMLMAPGQPPMKCKGTETVRMLGGFWSLGEMKSQIMGATVTGLMTLGYDSQKKKYVGTWVCSMDGHFWKYEGAVAGNTLTLETEGPSMTTPGKMAKMRDVIEVKNKDHKVLTSSMLGDDGKWVTFMTLHAKRKK